MTTRIVETRIIEFAEIDGSAVQRCMLRARRTAFVARFIVLREMKRSRAHRRIELMDWDDGTTAEELALRFRHAFLENGDAMGPVDRDLRRAVAHTLRPLRHFIDEYSRRATYTFLDALEDYMRSLTLLSVFQHDEREIRHGWRCPGEIRGERTQVRPQAEQSCL